MDFNSISIEQFKSKGLLSITSYRNDLIATDKIEALDPFKQPCRLNATTIFICVGGTIDGTVNLKEYKITAGSVLVVFAGDVICVTSAKDVEAYAILISQPYIDELKIDFKKRVEIFINVRTNANFSVPHEALTILRPYYQLFKNSIENNVSEIDEIIRGLVTSFLYTIISIVKQYSLLQSASTEIPRNQQIFDKFISLLMRYHCFQHSVKFYAEKLNLTPKYLSFAIKEYSGKGALEWINEYVLLEAKMMLHNSDISIKEIAYSLNFITQSAFGKYFKQQMGMSPKAYRINIK